jgi:hypothetical protein
MPSPAVLVTGLSGTRAGIARRGPECDGQRPVPPGEPYGRTSFANWAMQFATALRLPALAMQLSNVVKTLVLFATNVPKRTANTTATISAKTPHTIPAMACPWLVAPLVRPRLTAMPPRIAASRQAQETRPPAERRSAVRRPEGRRVLSSP